MTDTDIFYENLRQRLAEQIGVNVDALESLGLLEDTPIIKLGTPLDTLSHYLSRRLAFSKITVTNCISSFIKYKLFWQTMTKEIWLY